MLTELLAIWQNVNHSFQFFLTASISSPVQSLFPCRLVFSEVPELREEVTGWAVLTAGVSMLALVSVEPAISPPVSPSVSLLLQKPVCTDCLARSNFQAAALYFLEMRL